MDCSHTLLALLSVFLFVCLVYTCWRNTFMTPADMQRCAVAAQKAAQTDDQRMVVNAVVQGVAALLQDKDFMSRYERELMKVPVTE